MDKKFIDAANTTVTALTTARDNAMKVYGKGGEEGLAAAKKIASIDSDLAAAKRLADRIAKNFYAV